MSSSSSDGRRPARRVLRDTASGAGATGLLDLDLAPAGLARLDPCRIDAAVTEGHAAGYAAGFDAGRAAALAEQASLTAAYERRLSGVIQASEHAVTEAMSGLTAVADAAARVTAGAAFAIAEAIVGRELQLAEHPGRDAVARALALTPDGVEVTLRLNPQDAATLVSSDLPAGRTINVVADAGVDRGDCKAEAGWTSVDARISSALARVRAVLDGAAR